MSSDSNPTRVRILKSAWALLEAGGGGAVRMSDIAKAAGVSRQAVYLHFPNRADLLVATTRYIDGVHDIDGRLVRSRIAGSGRERLASWVEAWGNYIPLVYGVLKALMAMKDSDAEALAAWNDRMQAVREGCAAAVAALQADGALAEGFSAEEATDVLWAMLSVRTWEQLCQECGWDQARYVTAMQHMTEQILVSGGSGGKGPIRYLPEK